MFRHILCPTDFSKASERALEPAIARAQHDSCALKLLHVLEPLLDVGPEIGASLDVVHAYEVPRWVERDVELAGALRSAMASVCTVRCASDAAPRSFSGSTTCA